MVNPAAPQKRQRLLLGMLVLAIVASVFIWWKFLAPADQTPTEPVVSNGTASTTAGESNQPESKEVAEILSAINMLKAITLDTSFFQDEKFKALVNTPIEIPDTQPAHTSFDRIFIPSAK